MLEARRSSSNTRDDIIKVVELSERDSGERRLMMTGGPNEYSRVESVPQGERRHDSESWLESVTAEKAALCAVRKEELGKREEGTEAMEVGEGVRENTWKGSRRKYAEDPKGKRRVGA